MPQIMTNYYESERLQQVIQVSHREANDALRKIKELGGAIAEVEKVPQDVVHAIFVEIKHQQKVWNNAVSRADYACTELQQGSLHGQHRKYC